MSERVTTARFRRVQAYVWAWQRSRWRFPAHADRVNHRLARALSFMYGGMLYAMVDQAIFASLVYCYHIPHPAALLTGYWYCRDSTNSGSAPPWWKDLCRNS